MPLLAVKERPLIQVTTFYYFKPLSDEMIRTLEETLRMFSGSVRGLILLGREGINSTVSGPSESVEKLKTVVREAFSPDVHFKDSFAPRHPFRELDIQVRQEIVTLGKPEIVPSGECGHLPPEEWHKALDEEDVIVLDTRNDYEVQIGKFKNAIDMGLKEFRQFPERVREMNIPKDKKVLMYCTGGIRCEKAALEMRAQGYKNVFQLKGGILEYLREFPEQKFEGECFVFDYRVAVNQKLQPTQTYRFCPHCGQPGSEKLSCVRCQSDAYVCKSCLEKDRKYATCSKNCAHHESIQSRSRRQHRGELARRQPF